MSVFSLFQNFNFLLAKPYLYIIIIPTNPIYCYIHKLCSFSQPFLRTGQLFCTSKVLYHNVKQICSGLFVVFVNITIDTSFSVTSRINLTFHLFVVKVRVILLFWSPFKRRTTSTNRIRVLGNIVLLGGTAWNLELSRFVDILGFLT